MLAGRYRLGSRLGRGGMGTVWRAEDELLGREVAVKELHLDEGLSTQAARGLRDRTLREARTVAQVVHPHILVVHDVVEEDERPWIVMELIEGRSLSDVIAHDGPLGAREAARVGLALTGALRAAHARGVLHRDLKPANVLLESGTGRVVLTDFGIARVPGATTISETGAFVGSPEYTAPERMEGRPSDGASDLWSLGVLLCAAVEGTTPFWRDNLAGVLHAVALAEIRLPASAEPLRPVVRGLLERDPERRMPLTAAEHLLRTYAETGTMPEAPAPVAAPSAPAHAAVHEATPTTNNRATLDGPGSHPDVDAPAPAPPKPEAPAPEEPPTPEPAPAPQPAEPTPAPQPPESTPKEPLARPRRPGRARLRLLAAVLVAAVVGGGVAVAVVLGTGGKGGTDGPSGTRKQADSAADSGRTDPGKDAEASGNSGTAEAGSATAPEGYRTVRDPAGFRLAVPHGFTRSYEPPRVYYYSPGKTYRIGIHLQEREPGGAAAAMGEAHAEGPEQYSGYRDGSVRSRSFEGAPGAVWQFAWDGTAADGGPRYTFDQSWDEGDTMYDVWVSGPESRKAVVEEQFDTALRTFTRTSAASPAPAR
ncbi:serine/threonine protein kinase [Streptomyces sp. HNM0574]|nr:serine/threonine protein kinase [Streptomyces sp. HNM0574]